MTAQESTTAVAVKRGNDQKSLEGRPVLVLTTEHWTKTWFTKLLVPASRFHAVDITFLDIASVSTYKGRFNLLKDAITQHVEANENASTPLVLPFAEEAMDLYSAVLEHMRYNGNSAMKEAAKMMTGAHFLSFFLATNKLACRKLVKGCNGVKSEGVLNDMPTLPLLGQDVTGFFKPVAGCGSEGVFKCEANDASIVNPLIGKMNPMGDNSIVAGLARRYEELKPYLDTRMVGLVEEYISPEGRRVFGVDGFVYQGKLHHYTLSENIYRKDQPEIFDSLVTPAQDVEAPLKAKLWALWDSVMEDLVERGLNNQFVDIECFALPNGSVQVMEVNCRTSGNQMPIFSRVFSGSKTCVFSAVLDLVNGQAPPFLGGMPDAHDKIGVCAYMDVIPGAPDYYESEQEEAGCFTAYYHAAGSGSDKHSAHVYVISTKGSQIARERCTTFHAEVTSKFAATK